MEKWNVPFSGVPKEAPPVFSDEDGDPTDERQEWAERLHAAFNRFHHEYLVKITVQNMRAALGPKGPRQRD
jgi:hypothetical protein